MPWRCGSWRRGPKGPRARDLLTKKSGNLSRVGIFLDFVRRSGTTRTMHPHVAYVRCGEPDKIEMTPVGVELNGSRIHGAYQRGWVRTKGGGCVPKGVGASQCVSCASGMYLDTGGKTIRGQWSIQFRLAPYTCAPCGPSARVVPDWLTKSRNRPTRKVLPPFNKITYIDAWYSWYFSTSLMLSISPSG